MSLTPGTTVSHYRIVALLGRGGMGEVYHAIDDRLERAVALKILSDQLTRSETAVQRFVQEAHAASGLNHPNIVTVFDIGRAEADVDGKRRVIHYIAMELIEGETLRSLVARNALSLRERVDILGQMAAGLAKAHAAGIVHRDLKPDNVMVTTDGYAKVLDFGLAKLTEKERVPDQSTSPQLTQVGTVIGTIGYMAPEQVEHRAIDYRADIFAFGCVAYHALTGKGPFDRGSLIDTLHAIVHSEPEKLADVVPDTPAALVEIIEHCLEKNPEKRPQSTRDIALQLQEIARATDPSSLITLPTARRRSLMPAVVVAAVLITIFSVIALALKRQPAQTPFDEMRITRAVSSGRTTVASISPDGKYLAYSVDEGGKQSLWIRQVASGTDIQVVPLANVHFVGCAFSPDSNYLFYVSADNPTDRGAAHVVPVIGGTPRMLVDDLHARIAMSPAGDRFAYVRTDRAASRSVLATRNVDGADERIISEKKLPDTFTAVAWSPDGASLAFSYVTYGGGYHAIIGTMPSTGGEEKLIESPRWRIVDTLAWLPEHNELVVNAKDRTDSRNQLWLLARNGKPRRITNDLSDYESASPTADGRKLVTLQRNQSAMIWRAPGGSASNARPLGRAPENLDGMHGLASLPDGRVIFTMSSNDERDLWIMDRDGSNRRRVTDGRSDILPAASDDGKTVVFMSMRSGSSNLWKVDIETGATTQFTNGDFESSPSVSPDGTWVAFHTNRAGPRTVWRMPSAGGEATQITKTASSWPQISRDGKSIACSWYDAGTKLIGIAIVPVETGVPANFFSIPVNSWMGGNNHLVRWRRDGITYVANENGVSNIWLQPAAGGAPRQLTRFGEGQIFYFDWTQTGDLLVSHGAVTSNVVMIEGFR
ncbi:MAG TPA: protein kinase [Thermoanaerobaculia bacterium]|nr:protein kinase [Thermoanaerobaculia bacterium]